MKYIAVALMLVTTLMGCASWFETTGNYEKMLNGWVGKPADELIKTLGAPRSSYKLPNGETEIEYYESHVMRWDYSGFFSHNEKIAMETLWCRTTFVIDRNGNIASWKHEGNDCISHAHK